MAANMIRVSGSAYEQLRTLSLKYQYEANRQISMGDVIAATLIVANNHPDELKAELTK